MRIVGSVLRALPVLVLLAAPAAVPPARAQVSDLTRNVEANHYPSALPRRKGPPPAHMSFELAATIPLPGRLSGAAPVASDGAAHVPLVGGVATSALGTGSTARLDPVRAVAPEPGWVVAPDGARRFRTLPAGFIEGEKRCRWCKAGWRPEWKLEVAGATPSPPILRGRRLFFGARDDRVYCLRADNGHRVWAVDVGDRVSRPIAIWVDPHPQSPPAAAGTKGVVPAALVLVATDGGGRLLALDPYDGAKLATYELPAADGRLATAPAASGDGSVLIGREKYAASEADLFVFSLVVAPPAATPPATPPPPAAATSRDRLRGLSGKENSRGEDRPGESQGPRSGSSARDVSGDAPVSKGR